MPRSYNYIMYFFFLCYKLVKCFYTPVVFNQYSGGKLSYFIWCHSNNVLVFRYQILLLLKLLFWYKSTLVQYVASTALLNKSTFLTEDLNCKTTQFHFLSFSNSFYTSCLFTKDRWRSEFSFSNRLLLLLMVSVWCIRKTRGCILIPRTHAYFIVFIQWKRSIEIDGVNTLGAFTELR